MLIMKKIIILSLLLTLLLAVTATTTHAQNWFEIQKIVASDRATFDWFGYSVGISGNYTIVGAVSEDEDAAGLNSMSGAGSAYIFERGILGNWNEAQKIVASDRAPDDNFGGSVSISGKYAIVGANREDEDAAGGNTQLDAGSAYIFKYLPYPNQIHGKVYKDVNGNCLTDTGDAGLQGILVKVSPFNFFGITDPSGNYTIYTDSGTYQIKQIIPAHKV